MKKITVWLMLLLFAALVAWIAWGNSALTVTQYTMSSARIPESFSGYRIAQVSDLHNASFGEDNARLLGLLRNAQPDLIAITGDLIDSRRTDVTVALSFAEHAAQIAPTYFVTGNHEARVPDAYGELKAGLERAGVIVLENEPVLLEKGGDTLQLLGVDDPAFSRKATASLEDALSQLASDGDSYTVLLSHRPELFDVYVAHDIDLALTGHAHGGQFRLPVLGGLFAPSQGFFPEYDAGLFATGQTNMIVSRGLGNSLFPFRINNRPELVVVTLKTE